MTVLMHRPFKRTQSSRYSSASFGWRGWLVVLLFGPLLTVHAQEALRASIAGEAAAEARKRQLQNTYYNLMLGQVKLRVAAGLNVEGSDNVNLSEKNPEADLALSPRLDLAANWQVTDQNTLTFATAVGYTTYLQHTELNHLFISPDSDLAFNIYAGNFLINLHNRFQVSQQASSQPQLSQTANYGFFQDTAGVTVNWDLNKVILTFNYDHEIQTFFPSTFSYQDHASELFQTRAAWLFNNQSQLGLELGGGLTTYNDHSNTNNFLSDLAYYNIGPYFQSQITPHINIRCSGGYTVYTLDHANSFGESGQIANYYTSLSLTHQVNDKLTYMLSGGRRIQLGIYSSTLDLTYAQLSPNWKFIRKINLGTPVYYEHAKQAGNRGETVDRCGGSIILTYQMTTKLTTTAGYHFLARNSNLNGQDYIQNRLVLDLHYQF